MQVDFYHLTRTPIDRALPRIAEKILETGERLLIVAREEAMRAKMDHALWLFRAGSFLPHAQAGGEDDLRQPILIDEAVQAESGFQNIALIDGLWRDEALRFGRAFHFFDEDAIEDARSAWKSLADKEGVERRYWRQNDEGRWEKMA